MRPIIILRPLGAPARLWWPCWSAFARGQFLTYGWTDDSVRSPPGTPPVVGHITHEAAVAMTPTSPPLRSAITPRQMPGLSRPIKAFLDQLVQVTWMSRTGSDLRFDPSPSLALR